MKKASELQQRLKVHLTSEDLHTFPGTSHIFFFEYFGLIIFCLFACLLFVWVLGLWLWFGLVFLQNCINFTLCISLQ